MITIREITENDAQAYIDLRLGIDAEADYMLFEPGERQLYAGEEAQRIRALLAQPNQTVFVAVDAGVLVGFLAATGKRARRIQHSVYLVIGIRAAYTGQGIGTQLFQALETWAHARGLHRLELTVIVENAPAVALYQKMGFQIEGVKRDSIRLGERYVDEYYMGKLLEG